MIYMFICEVRHPLPTPQIHRHLLSLTLFTCQLSGKSIRGGGAVRRAGAPHSYESHDSRSLEEGNSDHLRNINLTSVIPHARRVGETLSLCIINDAFSDHKSSKNLQYTTTTNAHIVNIPRYSAHTTSLR